MKSTSLNFEVTQNIRLFDDTFTLFHFFVLRATIYKLIVVMKIPGMEGKGLAYSDFNLHKLVIYTCSLFRSVLKFCCVFFFLLLL